MQLRAGIVYLNFLGIVNISFLSAVSTCLEYV